VLLLSQARQALELWGRLLCC